MTALTADYLLEQSKETFDDLADTICLALKLKNEFEKTDDPEARHEAVCKLLLSEQSKGAFDDLADSIRLAMKLKIEFEKTDDLEARREAVCKLLSSN
jgi:predicted nucleic acid-binding protein